jgi:hypothetical protein
MHLPQTEQPAEELLLTSPKALNPVEQTFL